MPFRCIFHLDKHNAIGEGIGGNRRVAMFAAFDNMRTNRPNAATLSEHRTFELACNRAFAAAYTFVRETQPRASAELADADVGYAMLIERCDAPLT